MSETVYLEIPDDILHATRMTPKEIKRELAILLFQQGKLSFGKARELAQLSAWDFQARSFLCLSEHNAIMFTFSLFKNTHPVAFLRDVYLTL